MHTVFHLLTAAGPAWGFFVCLFVFFCLFFWFFSFLASSVVAINNNKKFPWENQTMYY